MRWAVGPAGSEWRCARAHLSLSSCPAFAGLFWGELEIGFTDIPLISNMFVLAETIFDVLRYKYNYYKQNYG